MATNPSTPTSSAKPSPTAGGSNGAGVPANGHPRPQNAVASGGDQAAGEESAESEDEVEIAHRGHFLMFAAVPSWLISMVFHIIVLIVLALMSLPTGQKPVAQTLEIGQNQEMDDLIEEFDDPIDIPDVQDMPVTTDVSAVAMSSELPTTAVENLAPANDIDAAAVQINLSDFGERTAPKNDLLATMGAVAGSGFQGRGQAKASMVAASGGTKGSEEAVARALRWLAAHQLPNGAWSFDHTFGPGQRISPNPGTLREGYNGATAMALLPFLGAGHTHMEGEYKKVVHAGLYFLLGAMKTQNRGGLMTGSFEEAGGSMYSHGLCSIVLCEAYGMTQDRALMQPAQLAINHIVYAQDPVGGGWRYAARQPGDTSVVGWQLMALKSGHMSYLQVPPATIRGASNFLDLVQSDSGAKYGYTDPGAGQGTTAVGLLCRMYLGWKRENAALERGVQWMSGIGPSISENGTGNMYYNYYATQVMRQYGGEKGDPQWAVWEKWNEKMRDTLVSLQSKEGPSAGSWYLRGDHGAERGGRLYCTSMATMILEVYYRHMPLYQKAATEEDFPL